MENSGNKPFTILHMNELFIGLMSGTSLDGMDAVLVNFGEKPQDIKIMGHSYVPYEDTLKEALLRLHSPNTNELEESLIIGNTVSKKAYEAIEALLKKTNITSKDIKAIGFHGQTIRHQPQKGFTLQIGNPALLAELSNINVIADFRSRDVAASGQGAPLVPAFHHEIFSHPTTYRAILNIGGIANVTLLNPKTSVSGFDTGPGNLLLDQWSKAHLHQAFDENGAWAKEGKVIETLLDAFFEDAYFENLKHQAKTTGKALRYIGKLEDGKAAITLQMVDESHPFFIMSGSDNIISFTTDRYKDRPLVVKGPGAGAEVTAAGVFADLINVGAK